MATSNEKAVLQREQIETMREGFEAVRQDGRIPDSHLKQVVSVLADIISIWLRRACGGDATDCALSFGRKEVTATLRQVLQLVPEQYQEYNILQGDGHSNYGYKSWLDESIMNVIIQLGSDENAPKTHFARGLASDASINFNQLTMETHPTRLDFLKSNMEDGLSDWNPNNYYTVPATTERIVCLWNYYENHWTTLSIDITRETWGYKIYNPLPEADSFTEDSVKSVGLQLGELIRAASSMPPPSRSSYVELEDCAEQDNSYDCGVYAVVNALALLQKSSPPAYIYPNDRRLDFLIQILAALQDGQGSNDAATPSEVYYWGILRGIMEKGSASDQKLVSVFDKALDKVVVPQSDDTQKLKRDLLICIDKALASKSSDEEILAEIRKIAS
ncbi:hypothetical protein EG329_012538 [Mollisiaceae sp. DMI_Dod_QoI]|nr:hypothetical protein EG329_012538 [Helotiales sp. DMI_Dod_QoI]